ncbi:MAG: aminotransferase class I/II-fold pyridoxal phosphate-dependent enzyme [Rhodothalassiaceae bacterium]
MSEHEWRPATRLVRQGLTRSGFGEMNEALYLTSGFAYADAETAEARFDGRAEGYTYSRQSNPTVRMFEARLAAYEGAELARATATGMAAMSSALLCQLSAGDHVVASRALFGSCHWLVTTLLPRLGIATTLVDGRDTDAWAAAVRAETRVFFLETPANPTLDIIDLAAVADIAHAARARLVVDNVFATPVLQQPLALGADIVCYSATKHIDGQGRVLGGAILCDAAFDEEFLYPHYRHTGVAMQPFEAWVLVKALETLELRVHAMCDRAEAVAGALAQRIDSVRHPSLAGFEQHNLAMAQMRRGGTVLTLDLGSQARAFTFLNALELIDVSNNLGDAKSIATHPWTTTHKAVPEDGRRLLGIGEGLVRVSVGLEDARDLVADVTQALDRALAA